MNTNKELSQLEILKLTSKVHGLNCGFNSLDELRKTLPTTCFFFDMSKVVLAPRHTYIIDQEKKVIQPVTCQADFGDSASLWDRTIPLKWDIKLGLENFTLFNSLDELKASLPEKYDSSAFNDSGAFKFSFVDPFRYGYILNEEKGTIQAVYCHSIINELSFWLSRIFGGDVKVWWYCEMGPELHYMILTPDEGRFDVVTAARAKETADLVGTDTADPLHIPALDQQQVDLATAI